MASECYLEDVDLQDVADLTEALQSGNNRQGFQPRGLTRFARLQTTEFVRRFEIVHQWSDNPLSSSIGPNDPGYLTLEGHQILANSGLSATLIKNIDSASPQFGAYTLSVRSTEYQSAANGGDRARDLWGADASGIFLNGFALAQWDALERYYDWLRANGLLPAHASLTLTGYSLSSNLTTLFTETHPEVVHTYNFNGPGRGSWDRSRGDLSAMLDYYRSVLADPMAANAPTASAPESIRADYAEARNASGTLNPRDIYSDARYRWAAYATCRDFGTSFDRISDPNRTGLTNGADARITQLYGQAETGDTQYVANSGIHGPTQRVFIEDQPDIQNFGLFDAFGKIGDFGTTHSITLLADSLALMRVLVTIDSEVTLQLLRRIFAAASSQVGGGFIDTKGSAEGDSLERILTAVADVFGVKVKEMVPDRGVGGFANVEQRNLYFENLEALTSAIEAAPGPLTVHSLVDMDVAELRARVEATNGAAYRYAIKHLNPFVILGPDSLYASHNNEGELDLYVDASSMPAGMTLEYIDDRAQMLAFLYIGNTNDTTAFASNQVSDQRLYTDLGWQPGMANANIKPTELNVFLTGGIANPRGPNTRVIAFGARAGEILHGRDNADRLFGGSGADVLQGGRGNDYVEGGAGMDTYVYRAETSYLQQNWNDGDDEIRDTDGRGAILYTFTGSGNTGTSTRAIGGMALRQPDGTWQSTDGKFLYKQEGADLRVLIMGDAGGSLLIRDFDFAAASETGSFGIRFVDAVAPTPSSERTFVGDRRILGSYVTVDPETGTVTWHEPEVIPYDEFGNVIRDPNLLLANASDIFHGSPDDDEIRGGGGNDRLFGEGGDDLLLGGGGSDFIEGGNGDDVISGHDSEAGVVPAYDELHGGEGNDLIFAGAVQSIDEAFESGGSLLLGDTSRIFGEAGDDILVGSSLIDFIYGGSGDDLIIDGKDGLLFGDDGDDVLYALGNGANMTGGMGNDVLVIDDLSSDSFGSQMNGGPSGYAPGDGDDVLIGSPVARDRMQGGDGSDFVFAGGGDDSFVDSHWAYFSPDTIYMGDGDDAVSASHGDDFIDGGAGNDSLGGSGGDDVIHGGTGNDRLDGGTYFLAAKDSGNGGPLTFVPVESGSDTLYGEEGDDTLYGREGNDWLNGGPGNDSLDGGSGGDVYVFNAGDGIDVVADFDGGLAGDDAFVFAEGIASGDLVLTASPFDSRLFISIPSTGQRIDVRSWFSVEGGIGGEQYRIETFVFDDGTTWDSARISGGVSMGGPTPGNDQLIGSTGDDLIRSLGGADTIIDASGNDILFGDEQSDRITDSEGHNLLVGGDGNDVLRLNGIPIFGDEGEEIGLEGDGAPGCFAIGGTGQDSVRIDDRSVFAYNSGDGEDNLQWVAGDATTLTISLGGGIAISDIAIVKEDFRLMLYTAPVIPPNEDDEPFPQNAISLPNLLAAPELWPSLVLQTIGDDVHTYDLGQVLEDFYGALDQDSAITNWAAGGALEENLLSVSTTQAMGGAIAYQYATTGSLDGLTAEQIRGVLANADFGLAPQPIDPSNPNAEPIVSNPISDQSADEDAAFSFSVPANAFSDPDAGDALTYSATLDGDAALPAWLSFDADTRAFSGTPLQADVGTLEVTVTATDPGGLSAADTFALTVANVNDAPVAASTLADQSFEAGASFSFELPAGTFSDEDPGETLGLSATRLDGSALPAWLSFDPATAFFAGNPALTDIGITPILVTATDAAGASAQSDFGLVVRVPAGTEATGSAGDDVLYGGAGDETLTARGGNDYLYGDVGNDLLKGGAGNDVLQGGAGNDVLRGGKGQNVLEGGAGDDLIFGGAGSAFIAGGAGNDTLRVGSGNDVIAFNAGDGMDTVYGGRDGGNTLSFGGGIRYSDLTLSKSGKDLVVSTAVGEGVRLKNWYAGNHSVLNLQVVLDATEEFDAASSDPLYNRRVQTFDFLGMVSAFDAARAATPGLTSWEMTNALLAFHLAGADDAALGGDLAYWYGKNRSLQGISLQSAQQVIGASNFGSEAQSLRPFSGLQEGFVKLA
jgi:Ca2+-binding RTX toxin-like protein